VVDAATRGFPIDPPPVDHVVHHNFV
jgi:hypothetical protein